MTATTIERTIQNFPNMASPGHEARVRARMEEMRTDPHWKFYLAQSSFVFAAIRRHELFVTEGAYWQCRAYLAERLLPRYLATGEPFDEEVTLGLAKMTIAAFVAMDQLRAAR